MKNDTHPQFSSKKDKTPTPQHRSQAKYTITSMSLASRAKVLSGYRRLFRARKFLFQEDQHAMKESRVAIRSEFLKHQHVTDPTTLSNLLVSIDEAEDMILHGIVQGKRNDNSGNIG